MSSLSCLRGSQACLNCLLASKPLICKLAPLVLSFSLSLSFTPPLSLCFVCPPLSFLLFCMYASILSSPVSFLLFCPRLSVFPFSVSYCQFSTMMHLCTENNDTINFPLKTLHVHTYTQTLSDHTTYVILHLEPNLNTAEIHTACPLVAHT